MASLQSQEVTRFDKDMYQSITPKKNRTYSENMARRRKPFLCSENISNSPVIFNTPKRNLTQPQEHFRNNKNELGKNIKNPNNSDSKLKSPTVKLTKIFENNLTIKQTELKTGNNEDDVKIESMKNIFETRETKIEKFTNNSSELSQISGYYSEGSINETISFSDGDTSIEDIVFQLEEQLPPLKNSTFIDQEKTGQRETLFTLNETESEYKTSYFDLNITNGQTKTDLNAAIIKIEHDDNGDSGILSSSSQNSSIPLIIIDEIEAFENRSKKKDNEVNNLNDVSSIPQLTENEIKSLKTLNDGLNPQRTECNETNKLKAKLKQMKLFTQIEIKNKVMSQIMEFSNLKTSLKLKHYCNKECEKKKNGSLVTCKMKMNAKKPEGYSGFLWYMWSTIKYPFVTYAKKLDKKKTKKINSNKGTDDKTNNDEGGARNSFFWPKKLKAKTK